MRRVVITGAGVISSIGNSVDEFWNNAVNGKSGVVAVDEAWFKERPGFYDSNVYAPVKHFDPALCHMHPKELRRVDIATQYALAATYEALTHAGITIEEIVINQKTQAKELSLKGINPERTGVYIGSARGG